MSGRPRRPGDPYEVGFARPPKDTRFKTGRSDNPNGRPRKKPDLYRELTRVLREIVTVNIEGQSERVTAALLLRLRDRALRGEVWAGKLLQRVIDAMPDTGGEYDHIEHQVGLFRAKALLMLMVEDSDRKKANQSPDQSETGNGE